MTGLSLLLVTPCNHLHQFSDFGGHFSMVNWFPYTVPQPKQGQKRPTSTWNAVSKEVTAQNMWLVWLVPYQPWRRSQSRPGMWTFPFCPCHQPTHPGSLQVLLWIPEPPPLHLCSHPLHYHPGKTKNTAVTIPSHLISPILENLHWLLYPFHSAVFMLVLQTSSTLTTWLLLSYMLLFVIASLSTLLLVLDRPVKSVLSFTSSLMLRIPLPGLICKVTTQFQLHISFKTNVKQFFMAQLENSKWKAVSQFISMLWVLHTHTHPDSWEKIIFYIYNMLINWDKAMYVCMYLVVFSSILQIFQILLGCKLNRSGIMST